MIIISSLFASLFFLFSVNQIGEVYIEQTEENILQLKKTFLKDTVDNLIREIDAEREVQKDFYEDVVYKQYSSIKAHLYLGEEDFLEFFLNYFKNKSEYNGWSIFIWNNVTKQEVYDSGNLVDKSWDGNEETIVQDLSTYKVFKHENSTIIYGVCKNYVDDIVKEKVAEKIRSSKFEEESYIWVNEVISYEGGDEYAIRRVHPNLPETEGSYLSTATTDVKGNYPYKEELEGVNDEGELFFTYYFKKIDSDVVSEKITYAKLYDDFDWIIAMGVHLDDIQTYVDQTHDKNEGLISRLTIELVLAFILILVSSFIVLINIDKWYYKHSKKALESEINQDSLTKARSRRCGMNDLLYSFKQFKRNGESPGIMMVDIDHFKKINDTYGHDVGDQVLKEVVNSIYRTIRSSDKLIRWGGDEFVGVFSGLDKENCLYFGEKLLLAVSSLKIDSGDEIISPTLSMGFSYFSNTDQDFMDAVKRADEALYKSKTDGRNSANIIWADLEKERE